MPFCFPCCYCIDINRTKKYLRAQFLRSAENSRKRKIQMNPGLWRHRCNKTEKNVLTRALCLISIKTSSMNTMLIWPSRPKSDFVRPTCQKRLSIHGLGTAVYEKEKKNSSVLLLLLFLLLEWYCISMLLFICMNSRAI